MLHAKTSISDYMAKLVICSVCNVTCTDLVPDDGIRISDSVAHFSILLWPMLEDFSYHRDKLQALK